MGIIKKAIALLLLWLVLHSAYVIYDGLRDEGKTADAALILGNKVNSDGTLSERLRQRVECGLRLYRNGRVKKLIVSGGLGKEGFYEGDKMKDYLVQQGVPDSLIVIDNKGINTIASVDNVLAMKDSLHYDSLIIVSQYFHLTRSKMLFRHRQFASVSSVSPHYFELRDLYALLREFGAYYTEI